MTDPYDTSVTDMEYRLASTTGILVACIGTKGFYQQLITFLQQRAHSNSIAILTYHQHCSPRILYEELDQLDKEALYAHYFKGAYLLSPFYLHWLKATENSSLNRLQNIAPDGFFDSLYYTNYYGRSGLLDEMGYIIPTHHDTAVLISLGRTRQLKAYSEQELCRLQSVETLVSSVVKLHYGLTEDLPKSQIKKQMADTLQLFGSSLLTPKERKVVHLMLRGHSSKSCARELSISPTTERVHRRNIYAKLNISSQAELFTLFFDALAA